MAKIIHQRKRCISCGACVATCPKFFEMDEKDGLATLKRSKKVGENFELEVKDIGCVKDAAEVCPVKIIKVKK
jgi:ferredoxin